MNNILSSINNNKENLKFELKKLSFITNDEIVYYYHICLVDKINDLILNYTRFEDYVSYDALFVSDKTVKMKLNDISWFLNQIFIENNFNKIQELTYNIIKNILQNFANGTYNENNMPPKSETVSKRTKNIFSFLANYYEAHKDKVTFNYTKNELFKKQEILTKNTFNHEQKKIKLVPNITLIKPRVSIPIKNRELPVPFLTCLLDAAYQFKPNLVLPIMIQAFCGLRESEICNIGYAQLMKLQYNFDEIDVRNLDLKAAKHIGNVKVKRRQPVYPKFKELLEKETKNYLILLNKKLKHDEILSDKDAPAFYSVQGRILTSQTYSRYVKELFYDYGILKMEKYVSSLRIPQQEQKYNSLLNKYKEEYPGAHMFRHYYTIFLMTNIKNINAIQLMAWRGDCSIKSSLDYINNKGILMERYKEASLNLQQLIIKAELESYFSG